jgi:exopolyphosphatase/guanosine-5'-triphosphate,3'-diphosphate pyrophosphatase
MRKKAIVKQVIPEVKEKRPDTLAVIDIGTTALRMTIAEIDMHGKIHHLETLQQTLSLGKDTFSKGYIGKRSIEECVKALKCFKQKFSEYQITTEKQIRIVGTTAIREAINRDAFVDRIYIGTGLNIDIIDEIDVARLTYLSTGACLAANKFQQNTDILIVEMSGGTTELLLMRNQDVLLSTSYHLGALRLREMLGEFHTPLTRQQDLIENDLLRTINQIHHDISKCKPQVFIALGSDLRFAATQIQPGWDFSTPIKLSLSAVCKLTEEIITLSIDEIVNKYHVAYSDAETITPILLFYYHLARKLDIKHIVATDISMRTGILIEMSMNGKWSEQFTKQITNSALEIGKKYHFDKAHSSHVEFLSAKLFNALQKEHGLPDRFELHIRVAALLHDIGSFVNTKSHHKHSMYLIQNCELFGLGEKDLNLIALTARYHRRSSPKPEHPEYNALDRESKLIVSKLAAILRIADALDRSNNQKIRDITFSRIDDDFILTISNIDDLTLEQFGIQNKGTLFEDVYGMKVILRKKVSVLE